jgi:hypothetical protein
MPYHTPVKGHLGEALKLLLTRQMVGCLLAFIGRTQKSDDKISECLKKQQFRLSDTNKGVSFCRAP